jgi:predicted PurR-regulated permease PerM
MSGMENDGGLLSKLPQQPPVAPQQDAVAPREPNALPTEVVDNIEMPLPSNPQTFFLGSLLTLAVLAAVYVASPTILPVVLAFVLQLILQPAVHLLERVHIPRAIGALFAILLVIAALVGFVAALSVPAATWAEKLPEGIPRLEAHLVVLKRPIDALQKVVQQAEHVADAPGKKDSTVSVRHDLGLTGVLFAGTRAVLDGLFTTVLVLYFLLVAVRCISAGLETPCCGEPQPSYSTTSQFWGRCLEPSSFSWPEC